MEVGFDDGGRAGSRAEDHGLTGGTTAALGVGHAARRELVRVLYHGSRGGIEGPISPRCSRPRADLGSGFYMFGDSLQARTLVFGAQPAFEYAVTLDAALLGGCAVVELSGLDWAYAVLHHRRSVPAFCGSPLDEEVGRIVDGADFLVGPVGDDAAMSDALRLFEQGAMTDEALLAALERLSCDFQVVARTERACEAVRVEAVAAIRYEEAEGIAGYWLRSMSFAKGALRDVMSQHAAHGRRIDELVADGGEVERLRGIPSASRPSG